MCLWTLQNLFSCVWGWDIFFFSWIKLWVRSFTISCNWFSALSSDLLLFSFFLPSLSVLVNLTIVVHPSEIFEWEESSGDSSCEWCWQGLSSYISKNPCVKSVWLGRKYGLICCFCVTESANRNNPPHLLVNRVRWASFANTDLFLVWSYFERHSVTVVQLPSCCGLRLFLWWVHLCSLPC